MMAQSHLLIIFLNVVQITADWCYTEPSCGPNTWGSLGSCSGVNQSPINITTSFVQVNSSLGPLIFTNYSDKTTLLALSNTGHTVEVTLNSGVAISGGGLPATYDGIAFHFHWGNRSAGSEHKLDGKQYPMEMHIVHVKSGMSLSEAKNDSTGLAVLGFFIERSDSANLSQLSALSNLFGKISTPGLKISLNMSLSLDAILGGVNRKEYYRYMGSLTTPTCDQAVVWTVFKNPILVPSSVIDTFPSSLLHNVLGENEPLVNNFRTTQSLNSRLVQASAASERMQLGNSTLVPLITSTTASAHLQSAASLSLTMWLLLLAHTLTTSVHHPVAV
ncbi:carbonic anhydrase 4-like [Pelodytes ibericus]